MIYDKGCAIYVILCDMGNAKDKFEVGTIEKYVDHMVKMHGLTPDLLQFCRDQVRLYVAGNRSGDMSDDTLAWLSAGERRN